MIFKKADDGLIFLIILHYWDPADFKQIRKKYTVLRVYLLGGDICF